MIAIRIVSPAPALIGDGAVKRYPRAARAGGTLYLAAGLPNFLKNLSTRPPMSLTDFWVPV